MFNLLLVIMAILLAPVMKSLSSITPAVCASQSASLTPLWIHTPPPLWSFVKNVSSAEMRRLISPSKVACSLHALQAFVFSFIVHIVFLSLVSLCHLWLFYFWHMLKDLTVTLKELDSTSGNWPEVKMRLVIKKDVHIECVVCISSHKMFERQAESNREGSAEDSSFTLRITAANSRQPLLLLLLP